MELCVANLVLNFANDQGYKSRSINTSTQGTYGGERAIAGGSDKGSDYSRWIRHFKHIEHVILLGDGRRHSSIHAASKFHAIRVY